MSSLEKCCICVEDDITTAIIFKCCIENSDSEDPFLKKYQIRTLISIIFDIMLFIIALEATNQFNYRFPHIILTVCLVVALVFHCIQFVGYVCARNTQELKCQKCFDLWLTCSTISNHCCIFFLSKTSCMEICEDQLIIDQYDLYIDKVFKQINYLSSTFMLFGFLVCIPVTTVKNNEEGKDEQEDLENKERQEIQFNTKTIIHLIFILLLIIDQSRLAWQAIKAKKIHKQVSDGYSGNDQPNGKSKKQSSSRYRTV